TPLNRYASPQSRPIPSTYAVSFSPKLGSIATLVALGTLGVTGAAVGAVAQAASTHVQTASFIRGTYLIPSPAASWRRHRTSNKPAADISSQRRDLPQPRARSRGSTRRRARSHVAFPRALHRRTSR